jgi:hypothetical protein
MAVPKRKQSADTETLRAEAQSALQAIDAEIAELDKGRLELEPQAVVAKEIALAAARRDQVRRIELLDERRAEELRQRQAKAQKDLIGRVERKLGERQVAALEIAEGIKMADAGLRRLIDIARDSQAAWPWQASDLAPTLLAPSAIISAIEREIYRQGARPVLGGGMDKFGAGIHFPGGKPTRIELAGMPQAIKPLADLMQEASDLASAIMRGKTGNAVVAPVAVIDEADRQRTPAQAEMAKLLQRQNELSADLSPEGEAAYQVVCAEIVRVSALVEAEKQTETHNA